MRTFCSGRLQVVPGACAPANREDVARVVAAVVVEGPPPAVKSDLHLHSAQSAHSGRADEVRVFAVHRFQFHTHLEGVLLWRGGLLLRREDKMSRYRMT